MPLPSTEVENRQGQGFWRKQVGPATVVLCRILNDAIDESLLMRAPRECERNLFDCGDNRVDLSGIAYSNRRLGGVREYRILLQERHLGCKPPSTYNP